MNQVSQLDWVNVLAGQSDKFMSKLLTSFIKCIDLHSENAFIVDTSLNLINTSIEVEGLHIIGTDDGQVGRLYKICCNNKSKECLQIRAAIKEETSTNQ